MDVLYYHQHFSTPDGAAGTRSYEMARALTARGHRVTVVCGSYGDGSSGLTTDFVMGRRQGVVDGIHVVELRLPYRNRDGFLRRSLVFVRYALRSIGIALTRKYDIVFASSTPLTAGLPGIAARLLRRKPFVFEVRDLWPELPREMGVITNPVVLRLLDWLEWLSYGTADACIGLSPGIINGIRRRSGSGKPLRMIPNGCDLALFGGKARAAESKARHGDTPFTAVFTGAHGIANGLDALLDCAAVLKQRGRDDIRLLMIGDGKLKPELQRRAAREQLDNCEFRDPVPKRQLAAELWRCDAGIMMLADVPAFYYGTSPNKFFDYLAAGLPVVNNYGGWLAQMIHEHNCGIAVPGGRPELLADALQRLVDEPGTRDMMAQNARALGEREFDRRRLAEEFVDFLEQTHGGTVT